jgi:hypothetical protein
VGPEHAQELHDEEGEQPVGSETFLVRRGWTSDAIDGLFRFVLLVYFDVNWRQQ